MTTLTWVGGTGTWNTTNTAVWSPAQVPTAADDVVFSSASTYTVTMTGALLCRDITVSAGTVTFATGTSPTLAISGSMSLVAATVWSSTGAITFNATTTGKTITTNGVSISAAITFNGVGGAWSLLSALTSTGLITVTNGAFDSGNFNITATGISSNNSNTRSITLGSSTLTLSGTVPMVFTSATGLTFNAGTSQVNCTGTQVTFAGGGVTFYNVSFTSNSIISISLTGANTFNNLNIAGRTGSSVNIVSISANQTISGTLTLSAGTNATMRTFLASSQIGTARTLTCAAVATLTDIDFRDITIAGAAVSGGNLNGTRLGNCLGNTGINFGAGSNKYWNLSGGGPWSSTAWCLTTSPSETPAIANFPLAQDSVYFLSTGLNSGASVSVGTSQSYNVGLLDMSARTSNTMTLSFNASLSVYGNWVNGTGTTLSGNFGTIFCGRTTQTITSAGQTFSQPITVNSPSGIVRFVDHFTCSAANSISFISGTFDANGYNISLTGSSTGFSCSASSGNTLAFGSGTWTIACSGSNAFSMTGSPTITGSATINMTSASAKTFAGGGQSYSGITLNQGGAGALTISGSNTFGNLTATTVPSTITITSGTTQTFQNFTLAGTSGNLVTVAPSSTTNYNFVKTGGIVNTDYLSISRCTATPSSSTWYVGSGSTNGGNNSGLIFTAAPIVTYGRSFGWIIT